MTTGNGEFAFSNFDLADMVRCAMNQRHSFASNYSTWKFSSWPMQLQFHQYFESPLGWVKVGLKGDHINLIEFCDQIPIEMQHDEQPLLNLAVAELRQWFEGSLQCFTFPVYQDGTDFQQRVWQMLANIPYGKTISYKTLALQLGDPKCIRAAAKANGKNALAIVVPCHRVIGADGGLVGYAGGLWRKRWLLQHEARLGGFATQFSLF